MAGKGDKWRKGTDYHKYYNSPFWNKKSEEISSKVKPTFLFLDDIRFPKNAFVDDGERLTTISGIPDESWSIVRSYEEFVEWIEENGIPAVVSFDNDLFMNSNIKYSYKQIVNALDMQDWEESIVKTGAHCAKYLVDKCKSLGKSLPMWYVHSASTKGRQIIKNILQNG